MTAFNGVCAALKARQLGEKREKTAEIIALVSFVAVAVPFLMGYGTLPLTNFVGEIVSAVGFAMLLVLATHYGRQNAELSIRMPVFTAFAALIAVVFTQYFYFGSTSRSGWAMLFFYLCLSCMAVWAGYAAHTRGYSQHWLKAMALALVIGCSIASIASIVQYFGLDGRWLFVSPTAQEGRTFGFIRQPNHQGTFLCLGLVGVFALERLVSERWSSTLLLVFSPLIVFGLISTGSRTAIMELTFVCVFALISYRRQNSAIWKALYPAAWAAVIWLGLYYLSQKGGAGFYGANKLVQTTTEGVGVRAEVWRHTWDLVMEHPWLGAGLPYYGAAFFMSGGAADSGIVMTHSHNLLLQMAFGFGIPITLLFFGLLAWVFWRARFHLMTVGGFLTFAITGCVLIHSQVEFPLWYTYFLLPVCWCLGWLSHSPDLQAATEKGTAASSTVPVAPGRFGIQGKVAASIGMVVIAACAWMNNDYYRVTPVFFPGPVADMGPRMERARQAHWFQQYVDFAMNTRESVTQTNYADHLSRASALGCTVLESWYQPNTVVALVFAGRLDEAKWILYSYARLGKGKVDHFKKAIMEANPPRAAEVLDYLEKQTAVPKAVQTFENTCYPYRHD